MTKTRILLAASATLAYTASLAHAASGQYPPDLARPFHSASMVDSSGSNAPAALGSSSAPLRVLLEDWDRAGFSAPMKPAQFRVYGRDGHVTRGSGYNIMVSLIRSAVRDSRGGRDEKALAKIAQVRSLLDR